jgi:hypothetical protein
MYGNGVFDEGFNRLKSVVYGRDRPTPSLKKYLERYGDQNIIEMKIVRSPIQSTLQVVANALSFGNWNKIKKKLNYDDIFHLGFMFVIPNGSGILEKNHVIQINNIDPDKMYEYLPISFSGKYTLNDMMKNAMTMYKNKKEFYGYNGKTNNCQKFVYRLLSSNGLLNQENEQFIIQNAGEILKDSPFLETVVNLSTDLAGKFDILLHGGFIS